MELDMQFFQERIKKLWSGWEIRVLVLLSLSLQVILILYGSRRKYIAKSWIKIFVWSAYLAADWVATVALANLATSQGDSGDNCQKLNHDLQVFWAPFLILHLGGPDTITAYSFEDNELWLRHLLGLVVQVGVAFNVFVQSWSKNALTFIAIPVFISGVTKYAERTFVLRSSSSEGFRDSLLSTLDPTPSLVKIMKGDIKDQLQVTGSQELLQAHFLFKRFSHLFSGLILSYSEAIKSRKILEHKSAKEAFNLVSIELSFMFDLLYTKAIVVYSLPGILLRCVNFLSSVSALVVFSVIINIHAYPLTDICISYFLLVGAVVLEVYAIFPHFSSDWTKLICLMKSKNSHSILTNHKRWSEFIGQFNLISFCLKADIPVTMKCITGVLNLLGLRRLFEKYLYLTYEDLNLQLQEIINSQIVNLPIEIRGEDVLILEKSGKSILDGRGDHVLIQKYDLSDSDWGILDREFDESVLTWNIAIDLCYHLDLSNHGDDFDHHQKCKMSRCLSNYMVFLVIFSPSMMPKGSVDLRFRNTCDEITQLLDSERKGIRNNKSKACKMLFQRKYELLEREDMSVLAAGHSIAKDLQSLELKDVWSYEKKWEMISEVCVEMLSYAANRCEWKEHGQQLGKGGELLTHVCLLMAHYGLSAQYDPKAWNIT